MTGTGGRREGGGSSKVVWGTGSARTAELLHWRAQQWDRREQAVAAQVSEMSLGSTEGK